MDISMLLKQIFGHQGGEMVPGISGSAGSMVQTAKEPSKFQDFGSLLQMLGSTGASALGGQTQAKPLSNDKDMTMIMQRLFGRTAAPSQQMGMGGTMGGRTDNNFGGRQSVY